MSELRHLKNSNKECLNIRLIRFRLIRIIISDSVKTPDKTPLLLHYGSKIHDCHWLCQTVVIPRPDNLIDNRKHLLLLHIASYIAWGHCAIPGTDPLRRNTSTLSTST